MRTLVITPDLDGYRLAFSGPGERFETIARFTCLRAAQDAFEAARSAGELVLTGPYLNQQKAA